MIAESEHEVDIVVCTFYKVVKCEIIYTKFVHFEFIPLLKKMPKYGKPAKKSYFLGPSDKMPRECSI
jgi:hypothetical protein